MRNTINMVLAIVAIVALVVACFFVGCNLDIIFIVAGFAVVAAGSVVAVMQERKLR